MKPESSTTQAISVWRRYMELPRYLRTVDGSAALSETIREVAAELGFERLCLVSGRSATRQVAERIAGELGALVFGHEQVGDNGQASVDGLAMSTAFNSADAAIAMGGGKTIDVTKLACEMADRPVISVPTQLTADGISSPVSVIRARSGATESRRARLPIAVLVDLDLIAASPVSSARAGLGDLVANPCAIRDWRWAARRSDEQVDDFAALLAQTATDLVYSTDVSALGRGRPDRDFFARLLEGLVLSGLAMETAGSSRPCSGSEHLFSHALDNLRPQLALHGEQVAFGTLVATRLQNEDWRGLASFLRAAGMERAAAGFGLSEDDVVEVLLAAPSTRPGRRTVLDDVDESDLRAAARDVLA